MNAHKSNAIEKFEPLPDMNSWTTDRVWYSRGLFVCHNEDVEAKNLIEFLGVNREEVFKERSNHIKLLRSIQRRCEFSEMIEILLESPENLSFPTAIESELGIPVFDLIDQLMESIDT